MPLLRQLVPTTWATVYVLFPLALRLVVLVSFLLSLSVCS